MIIFSLILVFLIEIFILFLVNFFKKDFQWLITEKDSFPIKDEKKLQRFFSNNYSKNLGWDLKKGTFGLEETNKKKNLL